MPLNIFRLGLLSGVLWLPIYPRLNFSDTLDNNGESHSERKVTTYLILILRP